MKVRPILLVLILLAGFYYATTHFASTGALAPGLRRCIRAPRRQPLTRTRPTMSRCLRRTGLRRGEQQNIASTAALPSVVNITSTEVQWNFFYGRCRRPAGLGLCAEQGRLILTITT